MDGCRSSARHGLAQWLWRSSDILSSEGSLYGKALSAVLSGPGPAPEGGGHEAAEGGEGWEVQIPQFRIAPTAEVRPHAGTCPSDSQPRGPGGASWHVAARVKLSSGQVLRCWIERTASDNLQTLGVQYAGKGVGRSRILIKREQTRGRTDTSSGAILAQLKVASRGRSPRLT